jgi:TATA-box binding protein (TBP) (component of TFIID and TFIIIB)
MNYSNIPMLSMYQSKPLLTPTIQNVITTADLGQRVDITLFTNYFWGVYDQAFNGGKCGYVKDDNFVGRVSIFLSGKMISLGGKSVQQSIAQLVRTMDILAENKFIKLTILKPNVRNIVATVDLGFSLDLDAISSFTQEITYEPSQFQRGVWRTVDGPVCLLYSSGKVVIVGSKSELQLSKASDNLLNLLEQFRQ